MLRCAKAAVVCWRGSEKVFEVGEEGRKTESTPQLRDVSGRSAGEF